LRRRQAETLSGIEMAECGTVRHIGGRVLLVRRESREARFVTGDLRRSFRNEIKRLDSFIMHPTAMTIAPSPSRMHFCCRCGR